MYYPNLNKDIKALGQTLKGIYLYGLNSEKRTIEVLKLKQKTRLNNIYKIHKALF